MNCVLLTLNKSLLIDNKLEHICLGRGFSWFDTGTYDGYRGFKFYKNC